jgi:circadian clock protein KaiC
MTKTATARKDRGLPKSPTGIHGLDEVTGGGLPKGRTTLICGSAGCGKTMFGTEFLARGALEYGEPGVFMAFEETAEDLTENARSLGFDLDDLVARKLLVMDFVRVEPSEIDETGDYDLEGLFIRLGHAIDTVGAKRVMLDTLDALFSGLQNEAIVRAELRRLFRWLKDRGVTAIITGERGEGALTRHGLEEYVSDCVILLDNRVIDQVSTRRLRIVKYRGSSHGTNEYPFLIDERGISVLPVTSLGLQHKASTERVSTGVDRLDAMLGGEGYYRGTTVLASGTAGSGKSSIAAHFARAAGERGERCLYLAFEESPNQIIRNMRSIGVELEPLVRRGLLRFQASRAMAHGLEMHLAMIHRAIRDFDPQIVIVDPISNIGNRGSAQDTADMLVRLVDLLKSRGITALLTSLTTAGRALEATDSQISSLVDTWLLLRDLELGGERNRAMYVLKSRGMAHSNQIREFLLTSRGIELTDVYLGPEGVLTGSARQAQEARERAGQIQREQEIQARQRDLERKRDVLEAKIAALRKEFEVEESESVRGINQELAREQALRDDRNRMAESRKSDDGSGEPAPKSRRRATQGRRR